MALHAAGVYLARDHRRALVNTGFGIAAGMLVVAVTLFVVRSVFISSVLSRSAVPTGATSDVMARFLRAGPRTAFVVGLIITLGAFLAGPSTTAVRIRARCRGWSPGCARAGRRPGCGPDASAEGCMPTGQRCGSR